MADPLYQYWRAELTRPGYQSRDTSEKIAGFYRHKAAKTRTDWPIAVWYSAEGNPVIKVGQSVKEGFEAEVEFMSGPTWLGCAAVTKTDYDNAMATGFWADGKPARKMDEAERMGIDIGAGDNGAPVEETIADQIAAAVARAEAITAITSEAEAKAANELADKLWTLFKLGDAERSKEKAPFDEGAKAVQAKWLPIINPAADAKERLVGKGGLVKRWLKAEQDRIDAEAAAERQRLQAEADAENERIRAENAKRAEEAQETGFDGPIDVIPEIVAPAVEPQRARAGNSFGRVTGLRKTVTAQIDDIEKLLVALKDHKEMVAFAQTLANRAAKAGIALAGMTIKESLE